MTLTMYGKLCTEVYELTKPVSGNYRDVPYFIQHLSKINGRILEAMVGTGRLLIPLIDAGLNVEGIDTSPDMLNACKHNCAARNLNPILHEGSIENLDVSGKFSAIVVALGSFMLLGSRKAAISALQAFAKHLEPNGRIFIDLALPVGSFKTESILTQRDPVQCLDGSIIVMQTSSRIDWMEQIEHTLIRYEKWKSGKSIDTELQHLSLHWFGLEEFRMCLREQGYTDITLCANYNDELAPSSYHDQLCFSATLA
jgi:SAM-dependent methyltransferase